MALSVRGNEENDHVGNFKKGRVIYNNVDGSCPELAVPVENVLRKMRNE